MSVVSLMAVVSKAGEPKIGFDHLINSLLEARAIVEQNSAPASLERAEGYRFILRRIGLSEALILGEQTPARSGQPKLVQGGQIQK